jgi:hypothetical protein
MTEPFARLERSLREGPPDESGYRVSRRELEIGIGAHQGTGITAVQRVIPMPRSRRVQPVGRQLPVAAVLLVAIAIGGVALATRSNLPNVSGPVTAGTPVPTRSPSASQTPTSTPAPAPSISTQPGGSAVPIPPLTNTFVSTRNGFSIRYPADSTATPATQSWPPDTFTQLGNHQLDELMLSGTARMAIASQRLSVGQTPEEWVASWFPPFKGSGNCPNASVLAASPRIPIDGQSGYLDIAGCPMDADLTISTPDTKFEAFVFSADRVYQITFDGNVDLAYFEALLATMQLDPSSAIDPPAAS